MNEQTTYKLFITPKTSTAISLREMGASSKDEVSSMYDGIRVNVDGVPKSVQVSKELFDFILSGASNPLSIAGSVTDSLIFDDDKNIVTLFLGAIEFMGILNSYRDGLRRSQKFLVNRLNGITETLISIHRLSEIIQMTDIESGGMN